MQIICDSSKCTGCGLCENACPCKAIKIEYDYNGFLRPVIDQSHCVDCSKCRAGCPQNELTPMILERSESPVSYACRHKDPEKCNTSTSGGAFHAIAEYILREKQGIVFGAHYNPQKRIAEHICITKNEDLELIKGSKYIQSETGDSYIAVRAALDKGMWVLFSGCPCQVYALYVFLGKDYQRLVTSEVVCHGVGSTRFFQKYLRETEQTLGGLICQYVFRDKSRGWINKNILIAFDDHRRVVIPSKKDPYMSCYYRRAIYRESCYTCKYAKRPRCGDFTLGDYFGLPANVFGREGDKRGISLLLTNSPKAKALFCEFKGSLMYSQRELDEAIKTNSNLVVPSIKPEYYDSVINSVLSVGETAKKYCARNAKVLVKAKLKELLIRYRIIK